MEHNEIQVPPSENTPLVEHCKTSTYISHNEVDSNNKSKGVKNIFVDGEQKTEKIVGFKIFTTLNRRQKGTLLLITMATFLEGVAFSILGPFFPTEATKKGMDISIVGFVFGIFPVVIFLTAPFYANYMVKIGPKFVFNAGIFVAGSCNILFGVLQYCPVGTPFIVMSMVVRSVEALGFSGFMTTSFAIVAAEFKQNVALIFGILETASGFGYMLGPTIGGGLYELGGFGLPFYFAGMCILLNGTAVYKFLPSTLEVSSKRRGSIITLLRSHLVVIPACSVMFGILGLTAWQSTFAKHLEPLNVSVGTVGVLFGCVSFVYSLLSSLYGYISDHWDIQGPLIVVGQSVLGVGFLMIGPSMLLPFLPFNLPVLLGGLVCIGISFGCTLIPTMKCMVTGVIELGFENNIETFGLVSGLYNTVHTIGAFLGPVGIGYLAQVTTFPIAYTVVGLFFISMSVISLIFFTIRNVRKRRGTYQILDDSKSQDTACEQERDDNTASEIGNIRLPRSRSLSLSLGPV